jgi:hypothetical protein
MIWKRILFHFVRVLLAGILLWWDQRIFLFYAFTLLLIGLEGLDQLRAIMRVYQAQNLAKLLAIVQKMAIPAEDLERLAERLKSQMSIEDWKSLQHDWRIAGGR